MKWRWAIPLAALVFLYTLIVQAPAATLYAWLAPAQSPLRVYGIDGTLGSGRFDILAYDAKPLLHSLHWRLQPWWLLLGRAAVHLAGGDTGMRIDGDMQLSPATLRLSAFTLDSRLQPLLAAAGYAFLPVDALVQLTVDHARLQHNGITDLDGRLILRDLGWKMGRQVLKLGDFSADAHSDDRGAIEVKIASLSGPLDLSGRTGLAADGTYDVDLELKAKPGAPDTLRNLLQTLGRTDPRGYYHIRSHGRIKTPWTPPPG